MNHNLIFDNIYNNINKLINNNEIKIGITDNIYYNLIELGHDEKYALSCSLFVKFLLIAHIHNIKFDIIEFL